MSDTWEALPQRARRRRPSTGASRTAVSATGVVVDERKISSSGEKDNGQGTTEGHGTIGEKGEAERCVGYGPGSSHNGVTSVAAGGGLEWEDTRAETHGEMKMRGTGSPEAEGFRAEARVEAEAEAWTGMVGAAHGRGESGDSGGGDGNGGGDEDTDAAKAARYAAVESAVEERSKMRRFAEGLDSRAGVDGENFEYLDHTADVQLHSWGDSLERAMEGALEAMFNVMTDIGRVEIDPSRTSEKEVEGHDAMSLLFALLDELLFLFHSEGMVVKKATIDAVDREKWKLTARVEGEVFDLRKHPQGTEVKAITYSNMQINEDPSGRTDIYVIVDI